MRDLKYFLFMLAVFMAAGVKGQFNPTNPAEPGGGNYTLTLQADPKDGGSFNLNATTSYSEGSKVNIRAYTNTGYRFVAWEQDGNVVSSSSFFTYTMPAKNVILIARFKYDPTNPSEPEPAYIPVYSILNIKASPSEGGYFNISSGNRYEVGETVQLRASTYSNYTFRNWTENGEIISTSSSFQYVMKDGNPTLTANYDYTPSSPSEPSEPVFTRKLYLNISPSGAGYLNVSSGNEYQSETSVNLRANSYQNYAFLNWTLGDSIVSESSNLNYLMPQSNVTLTANFKFAPTNPNEPSETTNQIVNIYGMTEKGESGKTLNYPVYIGNNVDVIGFVVDIFFPTGFEVNAEGIKLSDRMTDHQLEVTPIENNGYRLKVRGGSQSILGNGGKALVIPVTIPNTALAGQKYPVVLSNGILHGADETLTPIGVRDGEISIIGEVITTENYLIAFISDGDTVLSEMNQPGDKITPPANPQKEGFTFIGWGEVPVTMPQNDLVFTAQWERNNYKLTYLVDTDTIYSVIIPYNEPTSKPDSPEKEGYTFIGWSEIPATMPAHDVEIVGSFSINYYNLVYKIDGEIYKTDTVAYGSQPIVGMTPIKEGYTFDGWSEIPANMPSWDVEVTGSFTVNNYLLTIVVDSLVLYSDSIAFETLLGNVFNQSTIGGIDLSKWDWFNEMLMISMPAHDLTVTGSIVIDTYSLIYKIDGEVYKVLTLEPGIEISLESAPSKEGYTFSGWSDVPATMPTNDVEVFGSFSINSYKLIYVVDGEEYKTDTLVYSSAISVEPEPGKEGYTFSGWSEIPVKMPAKDIVVNGTFFINSYVLTYMVDGNVYYVDTLEYSSSITAITEPIKEGYSFSGWSNVPSTMPANDVEVTGTFSVNKYLLTIIVDGKVIFSNSIAYGTSLKDYAVMLAGLGIDLTQLELYSVIENISMPAHDVTISGSSEVNTYNLTYIVDGELYKSTKIKQGDKIILEPEPIKEGYTFSGWSEIPEVMPASDVEITGSFRINHYNLIYVVDGEVYRTDSIDYLSAITAIDEPTKEGYTFSGWSEIPEVMPASNVEITGSFRINHYNLIYVVDGEVYRTDSIDYLSAITAIDEPIKEGYTFSGWSEIPEVMPASDVEITGSFIANKYLLTIMIGGVTIYSDSIVYGTKLVSILNPIIQNGIDLSQWEWYSEIENITMPAHDIRINALINDVKNLHIESDESTIYDSIGNRIETDDINTLPAGIYIRNGIKFMIR